MKPRRLFSKLVFAGLAFSQLAWSFHAMESVVCIEEDGRLVVETALYGQCGGAFDAPENSSMHVFPGVIRGLDSHCGDCTDVALVRAPQISNNQGLNFFTETKPSTVNCAIPFGYGSKDEFNLILPFGVNKPPPSIAPCLAGVVLLI